MRLCAVNLAVGWRDSVAVGSDPFDAATLVNRQGFG